MLSSGINKAVSIPDALGAPGCVTCEAWCPPTSYRNCPARGSSMNLPPFLHTCLTLMWLVPLFTSPQRHCTGGGRGLGFPPTAPSSRSQTGGGYTGALRA